MERKPPRPRRVSEGSSEHEVYLPTGALSPNRQTRDPLPDTLLKRVKQFSGRLSTEAIASMEDRLPFFGDLDAAQRAGVQMLVQTAVVNFLEWLQDPESDIRFSLDAFQVIPQDLARRLTLRQTVDMVRVAMEFFEQWLPALARNDRQLVALTEAVLRYGRELGFAAASVYASAAESRGAWDTRLEALVVDAVVRGDTGAEMLSRAATLNWDATAAATVLVGTPPKDQVAVVSSVHVVAARHGRAALAVVQGSRLVMVVSGNLGDTGYPSPFLMDLLAEAFSEGPVVIGPTMRTLSAAHVSAVEAMAGMEAVWAGGRRRGRCTPPNFCPSEPCSAIGLRSTLSTSILCYRWPPPGRPCRTLSTPTSIAVERSRLAPGSCSFIQIRSAIGSSASPRSPAGIR